MSLRLSELMASMEIETKSSERSEFEANEWGKILRKYPIVRDLEANFRVIQTACFPKKVSLDRITLLLEDDPTGGLASALSLAEPEVIKSELITHICQCLDGMTSAPGVVRHRSNLLQFWTLEALRKELARLESVQNLQNKPAAELREIVKAARPPVPGYPELPGKIFVRGEKVKLDARGIKQLDRETLKRLTRVHGADNINHRLSEG